MLINGKTLEEIKAEYEKAESVGLKCEQEIALVEALIVAKKDAERYRWLRDDAFEHSDDCFLEAGRLFSEKHGAAFDEAIDAAIEAGENDGG
jgi:hypothetical protein